MDKPNKFGGKCQECGQYVQALAGLLTGKPGHWTVSHRAGECPPKPVAAGVGVYQVADTIYVVRPSKLNPDRTYACRVVLTADRISEATGQRIGFDLERVPGMVFRLTETDRMPFAQANEFSAVHRQCIACGAVLFAAKTIEACQASGIWVGPDCRAQHYPHTLTAA